MKIVLAIVFLIITHQAYALELTWQYDYECDFSKIKKQISMKNGILYCFRENNRGEGLSLYFLNVDDVPEPRYAKLDLGPEPVLDVFAYETSIYVYRKKNDDSISLNVYDVANPLNSSLLQWFAVKSQGTMYFGKKWSVIYLSGKLNIYRREPNGLLEYFSECEAPFLDGSVNIVGDIFSLINFSDIFYWAITRNGLINQKRVDLSPDYKIPGSILNCIATTVLEDCIVCRRKILYGDAAVPNPIPEFPDNIGEILKSVKPIVLLRFDDQGQVFFTYPAIENDLMDNNFINFEKYGEFLLFCYERQINVYQFLNNNLVLRNQLNRYGMFSVVGPYLKLDTYDAQTKMIHADFYDLRRINASSEKSDWAK